VARTASTKSRALSCVARFARDPELRKLDPGARPGAASLCRSCAPGHTVRRPHSAGTEDWGCRSGVGFCPEDTVGNRRVDLQVAVRIRSGCGLATEVTQGRRPAIQLFGTPPFPIHDRNVPRRVTFRGRRHSIDDFVLLAGRRSSGRCERGAFSIFMRSSWVGVDAKFNQTGRRFYSGVITPT